MRCNLSDYHQSTEVGWAMLNDQRSNRESSCKVMKVMTVRSLYFFSCVFFYFGFIACGASHAQEIFFEMDFESDISNSAGRWNFKPAFNPILEPTGMMYGKGDIYDRSALIAHSGNYSLQLNFDGRNGFCNLCPGAKKYTVSSGLSDVTYLVTDNLSELAAEFSSLPDTHARLFNRTDYFSRWQVTSADNSRISFMNDVPTSNNMGGKGLFSSDDLIIVKEACPSGERRSDCNLAINYLKGIDSFDFPLAGTLARRFYLFIPNETVLPGITFKLGYTYFKSPAGNSKSTWILVSTQRNNQLEVANQALYDFEFTGLHLQRNTWYYIEEVWTRESTLGGTDGSYELYAAISGESVLFPIVSRSGINIGELQNISIVGNWQNNQDAIGYAYFDDIVVATFRIGPVGNMGDPKPPVILDP